MNGIRRQLLVLVAGALLPLIAFIAWTLYQQHLDTRAHLRDEAHDQANLLRNAIDGHLGLSEAVLASLTPLALRGEGSISRDDLESVMRHLPSYATNLLVFDRTGAFVTAYRPLERAVREGISSRSYFEAAAQTPGIAVFKPSVGRTTGARMIKSALAYRDRDGAVAGVLVMTTDAVLLEAQLLDPLVERHLNVAVVTLDGRTIMRSKGSASIDATISPLREAIAQPDFEGELDAGDVLSFASARAARAPLAVVVFADNELAMGEHKRHEVMLAAALLALGLGLVGALCISRRISRPLFALSRAAETFGNGDLRHRIPALGGESGRVGRAFNAMAEQLEAQRSTIRADAERFRAVFENCPLAVAICDLETGALQEVNAAFREMTGKTSNDLIGKTTLQAGMWVDPAQRATAMH